MLALILAVLALGGVTRGSRRAIQLGFAELQTSELGKVLLALVLAAFLVDRARAAARPRHDRAGDAARARPDRARAGQRPRVGARLRRRSRSRRCSSPGTSWKHFAGLFALGAVAIALDARRRCRSAGVTVLKEYQVERLTSFLHPSDDPGDAGYQQNQSVIAIGSGERTGRGERGDADRR